MGWHPLAEKVLGSIHFGKSEGAEPDGGAEAAKWVLTSAAPLGHARPSLAAMFFRQKLKARRTAHHLTLTFFSSRTTRDRLQHACIDGEHVMRETQVGLHMLLTNILENLGYTAIEAADSVAGLKVLQWGVRIDLLVTEVGLPGGMNGRQMAGAGRQVRPEFKALFITGYAENALLGNGHLEHGMAVLTKPFAIETMAARIRSR